MNDNNNSCCSYKGCASSNGSSNPSSSLFILNARKKKDDDSSNTDKKILCWIYSKNYIAGKCKYNILIGTVLIDHSGISTSEKSLSLFLSTVSTSSCLRLIGSPGIEFLY